MKERNGFTLVELLGVLVLLAVIGVITIPTISRIISNSKAKAIKAQEQTIMNAAKSWGADNVEQLPKKGFVLVAIQDLISNNYIADDTIDDIDNTTYSTMCVKIRANTKYSTYDYDITDCTDNINEDCFSYIVSGNSGDLYATITGYTFDDTNVCSMDVTIPATLGGYPVKYINHASFYNTINTNKITSVDFSKDLDLIGISYDVFRDNNISTVDLSMLDKLSYIGSNAFRQNLITTVNLSDNLETIYGGAFSYNNISSISFPDTLKVIQGSAFYGNNITGVLDLSNTSLTDLGSFTTTEGLYNIGSFEDNNITSVILPNSLKTIGDGSFNHNFVTQVNIPSNVELIGRFAFAGNAITNELVFPSTLKEIRWKAFSTAISGGKVNFTNASSLTVIEDSAFYGNTLNNGVLDFSLASSLTSIVKNAFRETAISSADFSGLSSLKTVGLAAFLNCHIPGVLNLSNSLLLQDIGEVSPTGTYYGPFQNNNFTSIILPDVAYRLNDNAFSYNLLQDINFGTKITRIGKYALSHNSFTSLIIPGSVIDIYDYALSYNSLTNIVLSLGVSNINYRAFYKMSTSNPNLTVITNSTGKSYNWYNLTSVGSTATCSFIKGTCSTITIN